MQQPYTTDALMPDYKPNTAVLALQIYVKNILGHKKNASYRRSYAKSGDPDWT